MSHEDNKTNAADTADWWEHSLSRRDAHKLGLGLAAVAGLAGCDDDKVVDLDAIEAQKQGGWDVGDTGQKLVYPTSVTTDSKGSADWKQYTDAKKLLAATTPKNAAHVPWQMPTLFQSLEQLSLAQQVKPVSTNETQETYNKARAIGALAAASENPSQTLLIVEAPGAHSAAAAAGMAEFVEPVFWYDGWPHPKGVVSSHESLGGVLYYAKELEEKAGTRDAAAPAAIILDSNRLADYASPDTQFDNRYFANMPEASDLKSAGIKRVLYVTPNEKSSETDDLNDFVADYEEAGITVAQVPLANVSKDPEYKPEEGKEDPTHGYYYGGSHAHHTHFYTHYPMFIWLPGPRYGWAAPSPASAPKVRPPSYKPARRPTMFSSRKAGGASGIGRTKPTGFGRVSTRMSSAGKIMGTRSGSVGRFRSSSSFGG